MTEEATPQPQSRPASEELHWGVSYLREDIQDLRNQMREDIQETRHQMREDIQNLRNQMREDTQETRHQMREDIQETRHQIGVAHQRIDETNKRMDIHFRWLMTTLIAITGVLVAVIKL